MLIENYFHIKTKRWIQIVELKFEPVTLARLDCIPTPAHGNENL
jgi:hypothetical protein